MKTNYSLEVHYEISDKVLELLFSFDYDNLPIIHSILWQNRDNWFVEGVFINLYDKNGNCIYHVGNGYEE